MHLVSLDDWTDEHILAVLDRARNLRETPRKVDAVLVSAFFEPSTRTRLSFESAALQLGMGTLGFADGNTTSGTKGETLEDTVRVLCGYGDIIVLRHFETGAARRAAAVSDVPLVNAGDGAGQHPTQTLVDLHTIRETVGLDCTVAVVGDLAKGRTVHSLVPAVQRFGGNVIAAPVDGLDLPGNDDVPRVTIDEALAQADVVYATRVQAERGAAGSYVIDKARYEAAGSKARLLHPLPRIQELSTDLDAMPTANYFLQARNAVSVRMAIIEDLLESA